MLQAFVPNISFVLSDVRCKCVYLDITYVSHICCKCFICMLRMLAMVFKYFFASVSDTCFKYFICLQTYVASVVSGCFKSGSGIAHGMRMENGKGCQRSSRARPPGGRGVRISPVHSTVQWNPIPSDVWAPVVPPNRNRWCISSHSPLANEFSLYS
jgi:hypothetical protein